MNGRIDKPDDWDVFCFDARAGSEIVADVYARGLNSPLDSVLKLTDAAGKQLAFNDDHVDKGEGLSTHYADSYLRVAVPADGTYYLHLGDMQHKGGPEYAYRLRITRRNPILRCGRCPRASPFAVERPFPSPYMPCGRTAFPVRSHWRRRAPRGEFTLCGGLVPANQDQVRLTLTVPPMAEKEPFRLSLEGHATIQGREVFHPAVPAEDMTQAFEYRHLVPAHELMVAVTGNAKSGRALNLPGETLVRIPAGGTARVQVAANGSKSFGKTHLELSEPPDGITIKDVAPSQGGTEIVLQSDAAKVKPGLRGN